MKTGDDFRKAAEEKNISKWNIHDCSICGYLCGFVFSGDHQHVAYDSGCDCTGREHYQHRIWESVAQHYNLQSHPEVIKEMNKFWGFKDVD